MKYDKYTNIYYFILLDRYLHGIDIVLFYRCCIQTYHKGLKCVSSDVKKRNLIKLLSEYIIQLWKSNKGIKNSQINSFVIEEMQKAFQIFHFDFGGLQKPEYYIYWVNIVNIILHCIL